MPSNHVEFTREMREAGYTILVPNMLEFHFSLIVKVLRLNGYNAELLTNSGPNVMAEGLKKAAAKGALTGFGPGIDMKKYLLELEGAASR